MTFHRPKRPIFWPERDLYEEEHRPRDRRTCRACGAVFYRKRKGPDVCSIECARAIVLTSGVNPAPNSL